MTIGDAILDLLLAVLIPVGCIMLTIAMFAVPVFSLWLLFYMPGYLYKWLYHKITSKKGQIVGGFAALFITMAVWAVAVLSTAWIMTLIANHGG